MITYICSNGHELEFNNKVIIPLSCKECGGEMVLEDEIGFTSFWYRTPSDGKVRPAPKTPKDFVAVPYLNAGYHGGEYWAILPKNWTMESAIALFEKEEHMCSLVEVNEVHVPYKEE